MVRVSALVPIPLEASNCQHEQPEVQAPSQTSSYWVITGALSESSTIRGTRSVKCSEALWRVRTSGTGVGVSGEEVSGGVSWGWGSCEVGWTAVGWLCRCSHGFRGPGAVGVAHSRASGVGGNHGIMRNSTISSGRGPVPMCVDPPDRTWEPDRHTQLSPEDPVIPTKNSPRPTGAPASHVQHRRRPTPARHTRHAPH